MAEEGTPPATVLDDSLEGCFKKFITEENKQLPKKQTGFGTDRSKDEHTVNDHDIYHY